MKKFYNLKEIKSELNAPLTSEELDLVKKHYPDLRKLRENILAMEQQVAKSISHFHEKWNVFNTHTIPQLDYDLEWFLTWRVKLARFPHILWCDGAEVTEYEKINERVYCIKAEVWLGPESDVSTVFNCEMSAMIELETSMAELRDYQFQINYQGQEYLICKEF